MSLALLFKQSEKKAVANSKAAVKISRQQHAQGLGTATLCVMAVSSRDLRTDIFLAFFCAQ